MFAVLSKVWSIFAAPITLLLIAHFLVPEVQGFYYTFLSLIALQSFVGLGFYIVITQFARAKYSAEVAAANSHQTTKSAPTSKALPVTRVRIDVIEVNCGR